MRTKTIVLLIIAAFAILILVKNHEETSFWLLGQRSVSKSIVISASLVSGILFGLLIAAKSKPTIRQLPDEDRKYIAMEDEDETDEDDKDGLSDEDRDYIRL